VTLDALPLRPWRERVPFVQIEVTTICNFRCFYCAGRDMPQTHMPWERFTTILDSLGSEPKQQVSLQGEGEPTAHPRFWDMVDAIAERGKEAYTITNASLIDVERAAASFRTLGVSIDTLDKAEADRIGRYKLERVIERFEALVAAMGPRRVLVHTVDYGQDVAPVRAYLQGLGVPHYVQPLQWKADYQKHYADAMPIVGWQHRGRCDYIERPRMRYFNMDGTEMPCCFIKDASRFETIAALERDFAQQKVPASCIGCHQIARPVRREA
jgi:hypothetical protein